MGIREKLVVGLIAGLSYAVWRLFIETPYITYAESIPGVPLIGSLAAGFFVAVVIIPWGLATLILRRTDRRAEYE